MTKTFLIDTSRCTACRGCQIACKEWHELPANKTTQYHWGSHQNPPDLNPFNYKLVRFSEHLEDGVVRWNFFPEQCRHCELAPCKEMGDLYIEEAITQDESTGAVIFTEKTKQFDDEQFEEIRDACPYNVPRRDEKTKLMAKCTMCNERLQHGMVPACVKVCPTGTMQFGEREDMLKLAEERLAIVKKKWPKAMLADPDDVNVIYLIIDDPENYHEFVVADARPVGPMSKKQFLATLARPFKAMKA
ncbi:4Fe-4S dicluster domain-containing protein [Pseudodesulfovibrio piezophilus]|uniref:Formate dehydrogenase subunit beta n=1 Tax=Pseudodesulfovibrio piezophilus (strain DSM 21447 / JCM 15486 / C1TLV30) TaxID=1322246 RepID=M1WU44_PSEP2|nr:4Fe-4S dicluster domain-containing protein [Pseudodesulfovibrio piezophilus]CCH50222.1 Formate dehydrogenase subunit beta [Pseudodesulfovibrio piezophilus C1TLV30]